MAPCSPVISISEGRFIAGYLAIRDPGGAYRLEIASVPSERALNP